MAKLKETTQPLRIPDAGRKYRERAVMDLGLLTSFVWMAEIGHVIRQDLVMALSLGAVLVAYLAIVNNRLKFQHERRIGLESIVSNVVVTMRQHLPMDKAPLIRDGLNLVSERARYSGVDSSAVLIALSHLPDRGRSEGSDTHRAMQVARRVNSDIVEKYHDPQTLVQFAADVRTTLSRQARHYAKGFVRELQQRNVCVEAWGVHAFDSEIAAPSYSTEAVDERMNNALYWEDQHKKLSG
jgi:hypothetical protein